MLSEIFGKQSNQEIMIMIIIKILKNLKILCHDFDKIAKKSRKFS